MRRFHFRAGARGAVVLQSVTVYPVLLFVARSQILVAATGRAYPGWRSVLALNAALGTVLANVLLARAMQARRRPRAPARAGRRRGARRGATAEGTTSWA